MTILFDRYARQITLPEIGADGQAKLTNSKILVVGAGGLGSEEGRLGRPHPLRQPRRQRQSTQRVRQPRARLGRLGERRLAFSGVAAAQLVKQRSLRAILPWLVLAKGGDDGCEQAEAQPAGPDLAPQILRLLTQLIGRFGPRGARRPAARRRPRVRRCVSIGRARGPRAAMPRPGLRGCHPGQSEISPRWPRGRAACAATARAGWMRGRPSGRPCAR